MRVHRNAWIVAAATLALIAGTAAMAAQISAQSHGSYQRLSFRFDQEPHLQSSSSGTTLTLSFSQPLGQSASAVVATLGGYAKSASLSADGKQLTLQLTKPFRTRQFRSGNSVGIDLIGAPDGNAPAPTTQDVAAAAPALAPVPATPEKPKAETPKKEKTKPEKLAPPAKKPAAKINPAASKPAAKPSTAPSAIAARAPAEETPAILTTKPVAAAPVEPILTTKPPVPEEHPAAEPAVTTTAAAAPSPEHAQASEPAAATPPPAATTAPEKVTTPEKAADKKTENAALPFMVSARANAASTVIDFPWQQRTAAAVFERARDVWIVFSQPADANVALLRTVMPKGVVDVTQFAYPGATVLRLTTDGSLHATAQQAKGSYGWQVVLGNSASPPSLEVPVGGESTADGQALLLAAFDVADPLRFYDPRIGDLLLVTPAYEVGRGIGNAKTFPELTVLASGQGIVIASNRDDISSARKRIGIEVMAPGGLAISKELSTLSANAAPVPGASALSDVLMPYDQWYVAPEQFAETQSMRLRNYANASGAGKAEALYQLATLYLGQGLAAEAAGYLALLHQGYPEFYTARKLALLDAACAFMQNRPEVAAAALASPELAELNEAQLWREVVMLSAPPLTAVQQMQQSMEQQNTPAASAPAAPAPTPAPTDDDQEAGDKPAAAAAATAPVFHFLKWNKPYIHFYPPRIRQRLAIAAADAYLASGLDDKALATYETLNRDSILGPIKPYAELAIAQVAANRSQPTEALEALDRLSEQPDDRYIQIRARYVAAMVRYKLGKATADDTAETLERLLISWRGDALEHQILTTLTEIYTDQRRYAETLRTWRKMIDDFPGDPQILKISADMGQLFQDLFLTDKLEGESPLKSLALFYEFRDLTPVGSKGDEIIQKLADRLAAVDLLDRATQLLENQIKFRVSGEERSRIGARLALLYLLNQQAQEALNVLQITNYGTNPAELQTERQELTAQALSKLGKHEEALSIIYNDATRKGAMLRLDILWAMQDWPNVVNRAEDILGARPNLTAQLTPEETGVLLKLALGYVFESDINQLRYLRDYYSGLIPDSAYKEIFNYLTNDTAPLDASDVALLTQQISHTEDFLSTFKSKIAAGKLSDAIK